MQHHGRPRHNMSRRTNTSALLAFLAFAVTACGGTDAPTAKAPATTALSPSTAAEPTTTTEAVAPTTTEMPKPNLAQLASADKVLVETEARPGVWIGFVTRGEGSFDEETEDFTPPELFAVGAVFKEGTWRIALLEEGAGGCGAHETATANSIMKDGSSVVLISCGYYSALAYVAVVGLRDGNPVVLLDIECGSSSFEVARNEIRINDGGANTRATYVDSGGHLTTNDSPERNIPGVSGPCTLDAQF